METGNIRQQSIVTIPTFQVSSEGVEAGSLRTEVLQEVCSLLRKDGCLLLKDVFSPAYIENLRVAYLDKYSSYFAGKAHKDALNVGNKRFMITVEIEPPFNDPFLYANPLCLPIIKKLLGQDCVLGSYGSVTALPGAEAQHVHRDGVLFGDPIDRILPCFALTLIIPLTDLNELNGSTRMWKGSHVTSYDGAKDLPSLDPLAPLGSAMLMDYRLIHAGMANRSGEMRPILYIVYNRPWFKDHANFYEHPALMISRSEFEKVPETQRSLFAVAQVG